MLCFIKNKLAIVSLILIDNPIFLLLFPSFFVCMFSPISSSHYSYAVETITHVFSYSVVKQNKIFAWNNEPAEKQRIFLNFVAQKLLMLVTSSTKRLIRFSVFLRIQSLTQQLRRNTFSDILMRWFGSRIYIKPIELEKTFHTVRGNKLQ